jgi:integrase
MGPVFDFEKSCKDAKVQQIDKDNGLPLWSVEVAGRLPARVLPYMQDQVANFTQAGDKSLIFTEAKGDALRRSNLRAGTRWGETRQALGFPGLHFHDLRHAGNLLAAQTGTSLRDLMTWMGHDSPRAALTYQHASSGADRSTADALDLLITSTQEPTDPSIAEHDQGHEGTRQGIDLVG